MSIKKLFEILRNTWVYFYAQISAARKPKFIRVTRAEFESRVEDFPEYPGAIKI